LLYDITATYFVKIFFAEQSDSVALSQRDIVRGGKGP